MKRLGLVVHVTSGIGARNFDGIFHGFRTGRKEYTLVRPTIAYELI